MQDIKELVGQLISCSESPFTEDSRASLEALGAEPVQRLIAAYAPAPTKKAEGGDPAPDPDPDPKDEEEEGGTPTPTPTPDPNAVQLSRAEYDEMRAASRAFKAQQVARKTRLVTAIGKAQTAFTLAELSAMPLDHLEKTARMLGVDSPAGAGNRDYSGVPLSSDEDLDAGAARSLPDVYGLGKKESGATN